MGTSTACRGGTRFRRLEPLFPLNPPMGGFTGSSRKEESGGLASSCGEVVARMLQWKPKLIALMAILVLVAAVSGQFTWDSFEQFTWF